MYVKRFCLPNQTIVSYLMQNSVYTYTDFQVNSL